MLSIYIWSWLVTLFANSYAGYLNILKKELFIVCGLNWLKVSQRVFNYWIVTSIAIAMLSYCYQITANYVAWESRSSRRKRLHDRSVVDWFWSYYCAHCWWKMTQRIRMGGPRGWIRTQRDNVGYAAQQYRRTKERMFMYLMFKMKIRDILECKVWISKICSEDLGGWIIGLDTVPFVDSEQVSNVIFPHAVHVSRESLGVVSALGDQVGRVHLWDGVDDGSSASFHIL